MSETTETTLENLDTALGTAAAGEESAAVVVETPVTPAEPKIDEQGRAYATGKRKMPLRAFGSSRAVVSSRSMAKKKRNSSHALCCA